MEEMHDLPAKERFATLQPRAASTPDKLRLLRRQPTAIVEHHAPEELHAALAEIGAPITLDGSAEELPQDSLEQKGRD